MPSRLALRIYLIGLVQFLVVFAAMEATKAIERRSIPPFGSKLARYVAEDLARVYDDPPAFDRELERASTTLEWTIEIRDGDRVVAKKTPPNLRPEQTVPFRRGTVPLAASGGKALTLAYEVHPPGPPPGMRYPTLVGLVLLVAGVASFLAARSVTRPLAELTAATRAFGGGRLDARAKMKRADEIGEVASAFDDMADRVARLLLAERELLANVSHELRTPLARIRVALDLANEAEPSVAVESLAGIAEDLAELERIVDDVLAAARLAHQDGSPASSSFPVRREAIPMTPLVDKSVAKFRSQHPGRRLSVELDRDLPIVEGDPILVRRVIDNLLDNAHKYSNGADDPIAVRATSDAEAVLVEVKDRGVGIAPSDLERVFEPFYRSDRSRTRATGGLGLGLALVKRVVDAHGGTIAIESELGVGTAVRVRLPTSRDSTIHVATSREARVDLSSS